MYDFSPQRENVEKKVLKGHLMVLLCYFLILQFNRNNIDQIIGDYFVLFSLVGDYFVCVFISGIALTKLYKERLSLAKEVSLVKYDEPIFKL